MNSRKDVPLAILNLSEEHKGAPRFAPPRVKGWKGWAYCNSVYDGDTCQLSMIAFGQDPLRWTCRLSRIQTPEIGHRAATKEEQERAVAARDALREYVLDKIVYVHIIDVGKYKRPVVELFIGDCNVNDALIEGEFAVLYGS